MFSFLYTEPTLEHCRLAVVQVLWESTKGHCVLLDALVRFLWSQGTVSIVCLDGVVTSIDLYQVYSGTYGIQN